MARDLQKIDSDLASAESTVKTLEASSSSHATHIVNQGTSIAEIRKALGFGTNAKAPDTAQRLTQLESDVAKARDKIKIHTWGLYALATNALLFKLDVQLLTVSMQAVKFDLSVLKKWDEKSFKWTGALNTKLAEWRLAVKDKFFQNAAQRQRDKEASAKADKDLASAIKKLPPIVEKHDGRIKKIEDALKSVRDSAKKATDSSTGRKHGIDSARPTLKPVTQDVRALREAVNQLAGALGGF
ncbi:hypothetical protein J7F03_02140 [Streptomyces sp. ISL-43]|uniref:hypothetical protein n=1 Tax=Streptomyces sp. ISL-43 TaxID=2819183 RepID=UPI001BE9BA5D|nr:hypothetical protein [Streptomyces sp. ISL-43]MBT2445908.1 hypothetical protein [Streptomyces sp. ISL-43]